VFVTSDGRVSVVYGTDEYATQSEAEAASVANVPTFIEPTALIIAKLVIEEGSGLATILDERPQGTVSGSGSSGVTVHGALAGLNEDDHCFSADTELLTMEGWVSYQEIQAKKTVALTFNKETEQLEPSLVVGRYVYDTFDSLISLRSLATEILVTPKHKMVYRTCDPKRKPGWKWQETTAEEFAKLSSAATIPVAGIGSSVEYPRPDNYLRLLAWIVTEGSEINPTKGGFGYRIAQSEGVLADRINQLLEELGIHNGHVSSRDNIGRPVGDSEYVTTKTDLVFYVPSSYARNTLRIDLCDKVPGNHLLDLSARQFRLLLGEMILGDGNIRGRGKTAKDKPACVDEWVRTGKMPCTMTYASKNPALIDWLQAACARNGIRTKSTQTKNGLYTLNLTDRRTISKFTSEVIPYDGDVWCVSVMKNQTLVLRRKGRVFVAGNTQYLLVEGSRAMSNDLDMGANAITNVGNVDGVDVSSHSSRHAPGGADALSTGTPTATLVGASASEGSASSFARSDHQHGVAAGSPSAVGTSNADGTSSTVARSDHVHAHGDQTVATLHAAATTGANGFMSSADKTKLDGVATGATNTPLSSTAPVNVTKAAAAVGVGSTAARTDHKHDISTGIAAAQVPGDSAIEGSATSLARSDHKHSLPAFGATTGTFCQGDDSRLSDARTPTAHAASHKNGGSDFIRLDEFASCTDNTNLNSTTSAHGLLPKLGGGTTNFLRADGSWAAPPGAGAVFGTGFYQGSADGQSTTTSSSYQQKLRLTTGSLAEGTYRIGWFYEWGKTALTDVAVRVQINDTTTCMDGFEEAVDAGSDQYFPRGGHYYYTGSGVLNIDLDYRSGGNGTARIRRARLEIWRVS